MSAENVLPCPICAKSFSSDTINQHLDNCLNPGDSIQLADTLPVPQSKKRKSDQDESSGKGWGFLMGPSSGVGSKRPKLGKPGEKSHSSKTIVIDADEDSNDNHSDGKIEQSKIEIEVSPVERTDHSLRKESTAETNVLSNASQSKTSAIDMGIPLAEQMRPSSLEMYIGQDNAVGKEKMLAHLLSSDVVPSMILWGPPGCGKTTLAKIIAHKCKIKSKFVQLSATSSGVNDVKEVIKKAKNDYKMLRKRTILFLDEIHRFNKLQQDSLLPHVEDGTITLIGATTENPSFQVNSALLSRCRVIVLEKLDADAVMKILVRAVERLDFEIIEEKEEKSKVTRCIEKTALDFLANVCDGDARVALNGLQVVIQSQLATVTDEMKTVVITTNHVKDALQRSHIAYDKTGEEHYNTISALHKSMRGSDASAALYWLARMMEGGEEPLYIARRLIEFASEDVGLADPQALVLAVATYQATHFIGRPECEKPLSECVVYLARAPKSTEIVEAYTRAKKSVYEQQGPLPPVPLHLRNASTKLMKNLGYGKGYKYNPAFKEPVKQDYFPEGLVGTNFFK